MFTGSYISIHDISKGPAYPPITFFAEDDQVIPTPTPPDPEREKDERELALIIDSKDENNLGGVHLSLAG